MQEYVYLNTFLRQTRWRKLTVTEAHAFWSQNWSLLAWNQTFWTVNTNNATEILQDSEINDKLQKKYTTIYRSKKKYKTH